MGFREIPHTADLAFEVWAPDLESLFVEAARGLNSLSGVELDPGPPSSRKIELEEIDAESLLVAFLSELVYAQEYEGLAFDQFSLRIAGSRLTGHLGGCTIRSVAKPIKAVTYHNMTIQGIEGGLRVEIVLDV